MTIVINGVIRSSRENIEAMHAAIIAMQGASRAEPGCREYAFSLDLEDPTLLRITERWDSMEALQAHFATDHMAAFRASMAEHPPESSDVTFYRAEAVDPPAL